MAWRFRRSIRIAPGIRMNFSGSGASWTLGPRGASVSIGRRGAYANTSIPGVGLYQRTKIGSGPHGEQSSRASATTSIGLSVGVNDDGTLRVARTDGGDAAPELLPQVIKQHRSSLMGLLEREAEERQDKVEALANVHVDMPDPGREPTYTPVPFSAPEPPVPKEPEQLKYGLLGRFFQARRESVDAENTERLRAYAEEMEAREAALSRIRHARAEHDAEQERLKQLFERDVRGNVAAMEEALELVFEGIPWPRETRVSFEVSDEGTYASVDVDLPEIEDLPRSTWVVLKREMRLTEKDMSPGKSRDLYSRHVHSVGLRLVGEVFATLPTIQTVLVSGYSQRPNKATGQTEDQHLFSSTISRSQWTSLNLREAHKIDPVAAFDSFETRRKVTKTGIFTPIEPFRLSQ